MTRQAGAHRRFRQRAFAVAALGALTLLAAAPVAAAGLILLPVRTEGVAGDPVRIDLLVTNETDAGTTFTIPDKLDVRVSAADRAFNVALERDPASPAGTLQLAPGSLRRISYQGTLPAQLRGTVTLRARGLEATTAMMHLAPAAEPLAQEAAEPAGTQAAAPAPAPETEAALSRTAAFAQALSGYEPVYFAVGAEGDSAAKFQLSLKFRFFNEKAGLARRIRFLEDLYFGYTQTSLWDLDAPSSPFEDTAYKPRLFYSNPSSWTTPLAPVRLGVEGGLGHESNGRDGADSRSINVAYVRPSLVFGRPAEWQLTFAPMIVDYLDKEDNPDIDDYRGHVDWYASLGKSDSTQLAATYRRGIDGWSIQLDLTYPLRSVALGNLNGYLLFQYFDGYGETILRYNEESDPQYRLGLMFVR
jgi:outer membrane phospholipase A